MPTALQRFLAKIDWCKVQGPDDCWPWTGSKFSNGYGYFHVSHNPRKVTTAHRWAYKHFVGSVDDVLDLDHTCHNEDKSCVGGWACVHRGCANPAHVIPATRSNNLKRSPNMGKAQLAKTHCPKGHPYEGENLYFTPDGRRVCVTCRTDKKRAVRQALVQDNERLSEYRKKDAERAREKRRLKAGGKLGPTNAEKTHCAKGHPFSGDNLRIDTKTGARKCRQCARDASQRAYEKRMAKKLAG